MIPLPPGCTIHYPIYIELDELTTEMIDWFKLIGGDVKTDTYWNSRGKEITRHLVRYGKAKFCYHRQDGSSGVRLHFDGIDASVASMFLIKFFKNVQTNNIQEHMERLEKQY